SGHIHTIKNVANDAKSLRAAEAIETAAKRAATLTSQLLSFSRRQHVRPEPIDVGRRIQAVRDVLISGSGRNVSLEVNIASDTWPVVVDVSEFETALVNLVVNARDAMPDGGRILLSTRNEVDD